MAKGQELQEGPGAAVQKNFHHHTRDPIVVVEKGDSEDGSGGGCDALALSGLGLVLLPLLILTRKSFR